ncbi:putative histone-lysine N-methyltransferase 1 [Pieris rapae]|uniref:putative histone-lysine N-methyltransferase 1 n=1 Tax=Pieris rapae TaxID=64459 RepID=UPI001E27A27A|nr:putative histone-lysine N-methyltransferase 1 [Pieris rapae]
MSFKIYFLLVLPLLSKQSDNCKNLKCPNQEDSTCVKVTYRKGFKNIEYNVIVYNKCEIGYIKCHPGMKAYILPMRNCHSSIKRSKREIKRARRTFHRIGKGKKLYLYGDNLSDPSSDDVKNYPKKKLSNKKLNNKVRDEQLENEQDGNENDNNDENNNDQDDKIDDDDTPRMDSTEALVVLNSTSVEKHVMTPNEDHNHKDKEDEGLDSINVIDEEQGVSLDDTLDHSNGTETNKDKESFTDRGSDEKNEDVAQNEETRIDPNSGEKKEVFNDDVKVPKDYDHTEENNANLEEDNKDCPSTCSLRDMMICARCNHGVYRTFMSVCHLRAFLCAHTHEKLSLVSRQPCIQSAPFLSDLPPSSGRVHEPSDNDRVLQFIRCRAEGRLDKGDPKCNFNR